MSEKLNAIKELWAKTGRRPPGTAQPPPRLPPGQRQTRDWPVLDIGGAPRLDPDSWSFSVSGLVEQPLRWSWADWQAQPRCEMTLDLHCVTGWSRFDTQLSGVSARHLLAQIRPTATAAYVMLHSYDGYTTNLPLSFLDDEDVLLADQWDGKPLPPEHGGPLRLVVPRLYIWKSAKWLRHITITDTDTAGYWEARGYHMRGDPWTEERYG